MDVVRWMLVLVLLGGCQQRSAVTAPHIRFLKAGPGDVAAQAREQALFAADEKRNLLIYVGAPWCEPCQRFREAAQRGELDGLLPPMVLLEFDADVDSVRLKEAGYSSRLIPLMALPGPDGRASGQHMEGSIKGEGAVAQMTPRLQALLRSLPSP